MLAQLAAADPWRFQFHPEVWVLVGFLTGAYIYMVRVIGPKAVPAGQPAVTRRNIGCFVGAMVMLWVASDWPVHDIGEEYLYSVHMAQHMMLSYFLPPLVLMATPEWLLRVLVGNGRFYRVVVFFTRPVVAAVLFNAIVIITHIPGVVAASVEQRPAALHAALRRRDVLVADVDAGRRPVPRAADLTDRQVHLPLHPVARADDPRRVADVRRRRGVQDLRPARCGSWGLSVVFDQQLAGAIMKTGGGIFLWAIIIYIFFKKFASGFEYGNTYRRPRPMPDAELTGDSVVDEETPLTTADVEREFAQVPPAFHRLTRGNRPGPVGPRPVTSRP